MKARNREELKHTWIELPPVAQYPRKSKVFNHILRGA